MNIVERIAIGMLEAIFAPFREFLKLLVALIMGLIGALLLPIRVGGLVDDFQSKLEFLSLVIGFPIGDFGKAIMALGLIAIVFKK